MCKKYHYLFISKGVLISPDLMGWIAKFFYGMGCQGYLASLFVSMMNNLGDFYLKVTT
jgi:hypothetical protein